MNTHEMIAANLPAGEPAALERRERLLAGFLAALTDTGAEEAVAVLDRPLAELEDAFLARLTDLEQLL